MKRTGTRARRCLSRGLLGVDEVLHTLIASWSCEAQFRHDMRSSSIDEKWHMVLVRSRRRLHVVSEDTQGHLLHEEPEVTVHQEGLRSTNLELKALLCRLTSQRAWVRVSSSSITVDDEAPKVILSLVKVLNHELITCL